MISRKLLNDIAFDGLYYSRVLKLFQPSRSGIGVIFMLHRVVPGDDPILAPNLAARDIFLDRTLGYIRRIGWDVVSLSEARRRILSEERTRNFVCFTFDDGYTDVLTVALPLFRRHNAPLCAYLTTGLIERSAVLWWPVLERLILSRDQIQFLEDGAETKLETVTLKQKRLAYEKLSRLTDKNDVQSHAKLIDLFQRNQFDTTPILENLILNWDQARELAADPLVEIGCHTVSHPALAKLSDGEARRELSDCRDLLQKKLGVPVNHLSYPYGTKNECSVREFELARDLGFQTATTTRRGSVFPIHKNHLTALPRINIPGADSSSLRFVRKCLFGESPWPSYAPTPVTD
jgi:peptidoglycan/xylan/chitin deacetylase (PgdA/CDA1 family)